MTTPVQAPQKETPSVWIKGFVVILLGMIIVCGLFGFELWPFSGLKLFSQVRTSRSTTWQVTVVYKDGKRSPYPFERLPRADRNARFVLEQLSNRSEQEKKNVCDYWKNDLPNQSLIQSVDFEHIDSIRHFDGSSTIQSQKMFYSC